MKTTANTVGNTETVRNTGTMRDSKVRVMVQIAMLAGVAAVLMLFEFPIPFLAPSFYELDFSEVPVLIGAFAMGPLAGAMIELLKILLNFVLNGTITAGVGELANFLMGCAFVVPAGLIYQKKKNKKHALLGMIVGVICMVIASAILNSFVLLPAYGKAFGAPIDAFVQMGQAIIPAIHNVFTFALFCVVPFNLLKGVVVSFMTLVLYKHISRLLKGNYA